LTITVLEKALVADLSTMIYQANQGEQYVTPGKTTLLLTTARISMRYIGEPTENLATEKFIRTFKEGPIDYNECKKFQDAVEQINHWMEINCKLKDLFSLNTI
jgi:hypothetical protein